MHNPFANVSRTILLAAGGLTAVLQAAPTLTQQPAPTVITTSGQAATFAAQATGSGTLHWQWRRVGVPLAGKTGASLTLPAATMADAGFYDVVVTDNTGSTTSAPSRLMITPAGGYKDTFRLDTTFRPTFEKDGASIAGLAVAPGGKIYVAGDFVRIAGVARPGLARFSADLALDQTFTPPALSNCTWIATQSDGKLLVAANVRRADGTTAGPLVRLLSDGTIDPGFTAPTFGPRNSPYSIPVAAVQSDGKILVAGSFILTENPAYSALVRLNADGSIDSTFAPQLGQSPSINRLSLDGEKIVVLGTFQGSSGTSRSLIRLNSDGSEDTSLNPRAYDLTYRSALAVDAAGRIYVNGKRTTGGMNETLRLFPDGAIDASFATYPPTAHETVTVLPGDRIIGTWWNGAQPMASIIDANGSRQSSCSFANSASSLPYQFAIAPDGSIYARGGNYGPFTGGAARLSATCEVLSSIPSGLVSPTAPLAVHPVVGGKWLVGGAFNYVNGAARQYLARLNADGTTDTSFNPDCWFQVSKLTVQGDGAILTMGPNSPYACRFLADGGLDPTFPFAAKNGVQSLDRFLALPDGRMAFMGWLSGSYDNQSLNTSVLILQPDGAIDPTSPSLLRAGFNTSNILTQAVGGGFVAAGTFQTATGTLSLLWQDRIGGTLFPQSNPPGLPSLSAVCFDSNGTLVAVSRSTSEVLRLNAQGSVTSTKSLPTLNPRSPATSYPETNGRILLEATVSLGTDGFGPLVRLNANDTIDTAFHIADLTATSGIFPYTDLHYTDDGRLLVCGAYGTRDGVEQNGLALFKSETLPPRPAFTRQPPSLNVPAGGSVTFEIEVSGTITSYRWYKDSKLLATTSVPQLTLDNIATSSYGTYTVEVIGPGGIVRSKPFVLGLAPTGVPFSEWIAASNAPIGQRGELDTPAQDGVPNLLKYALGVAPLDDAQAHLPTITLDTPAGQMTTLAVVFIRNPRASGARCALEISTDLVNWSEAASTVATLDTNPDGTELVRLRETSPATGTRRFARLKVTQAGP